MAEVVQDLFDYVTCAGGVGRRRVDAVRGFGAGTPRPGHADFAIVREEAGADSVKYPHTQCMEDLMFHEILDKPFEQKGYRAQLEEFAYRGERIIRQIDFKFGVLHRMMESDVLRRSSGLYRLLRLMNDVLYKAHGLICQELDEVWNLRLEPFFYPGCFNGGPSFTASAGMPVSGKVSPADLGGWLDLGDMILTIRLLMRYVEELVALVSMVVQELPEEVFAERLKMRETPPHPILRAITEAFAARVPWIGAALRSDAECLAAAQSPPSVTANQLNEAIAAMDEFLTVHMRSLRCDLHRTMYQAFFRMCGAYVRWKRSCQEDRLKAVERDAVQRNSRSSRKDRRSSTITRAQLRRGSSFCFKARAQPAVAADGRPKSSLRRACTMSKFQQTYESADSESNEAGSDLPSPVLEGVNRRSSPELGVCAESCASVNEMD